MHGMWGCPADWHWVRELLEARRVEVVVPDLPSHRLAGAGLLDDAEAVREAIRTAGSHGPAVAVGWSYGCDAVSIAADGEAVARLVLVSSVPQAIHLQPRDGTLFDGSPDYLWDEAGRFVPRGGWWHEEGTGFSAEVRAHFDANPRRPVTRRTLSDPVPAAAWTRIPTTVLLGRRDAFNGEQPWVRARERVSDVRVLDCDHFVPFTLPGLVADVILEGVGGGPRGTEKPLPDPHAAEGEGADVRPPGLEPGTH